MEYVELMKNGLITEQAVVNWKLSKPPPTRMGKKELQQKSRQDRKSSFKYSLHWYNIKNVVSTLEAMQKLFAFYHEKDIDTLKLVCILRNLGNMCLHNPTDVKFYPFTDGGRNFWENYREGVVDGPFIVFTRKAVVDGISTENQQFHANLKLGLILANRISTHCVNPC